MTSTSKIINLDKVRHLVNEVACFDIVDGSGTTADNNRAIIVDSIAFDLPLHGDSTSFQEEFVLDSPSNFNISQRHLAFLSFPIDLLARFVDASRTTYVRRFHIARVHDVR